MAEAAAEQEEHEGSPAFGKKHIDYPQHVWENVMRPDEVIVEQFGRHGFCDIWNKANQLSTHRTSCPIRHSGGSVMVR